MAWSPLRFGKHKGKTLPQVLFHDPEWFFWAYEDERLFKDSPPMLRREADTLYARARSIRIPQNGSETRVVEYEFYPGTEKFCGFEIVEESRPRHEGSTGTSRSTHIDMSIPRRQADYDKLGFKLLVDELKQVFFGDSEWRMTKGRCEAFFDDAANFEQTG